MEPEFFLFCLVFFIAGWIQGIVGFGFAVATTLLLINRIDFTTLVFLNLSMSLITSIIAMLSGKNLRMIDRVLLLRLCLLAAVGLAIGLLIVEWVNPLILKKVTLLVILVASILSLFRNVKLFGKKNMVWISGLTSGLLTPSTGINGPMVALHLNARLSDKTIKRATMLAYLCFIMGAGVLLMGYQQQFSNETWQILMKLVIPSVLGYGAGLLTFKQLSDRSFRIAVTSFLIVSSLLSLLYLFF